ncbi:MULTISPECIES: hypothetical protein [unclassified Paenibacillus]|nr:MULTISPECIES: hypothetical protein [unclassified Paenibacillus]
MAKNKNNKNRNLSSNVAQDVEFAAETSATNKQQQTNTQNQNK